MHICLASPHLNKLRCMKPLQFIKLVHTLIWLFFNLVIFYLFYAVVINKIDKWVWICLTLVLFEVVVLMIFKASCPVTLIARKYSASTKDNFDIYLPNWLARYNKTIYGIIMGVILIILLYRLIAN
jgi:hypothetical protein